MSVIIEKLEEILSTIKEECKYGALHIEIPKKYPPKFMDFLELNLKSFLPFKYSIERPNCCIRFVWDNDTKRKIASGDIIIYTKIMDMKYLNSITDKISNTLKNKGFYRLKNTKKYILTSQKEGLLRDLEKLVGKPVKALSLKKRNNIYLRVLQ